mmetsp:Transcript_43619/g.87957  ORF Transcript_43619/g.87957 Transcript_43619/m.87957 type:complete len:320 (-) Transcript_43619:346-1305(-)
MRVPKGVFSAPAIGESSWPSSALNWPPSRLRNLRTTSLFSSSSRELVAKTMSPPGFTRAPAHRRSSSMRSAFFFTAAGSCCADLPLRFANARAEMQGGSTRTLSKGACLLSTGGTLAEASHFVTSTRPCLPNICSGRKAAKTPSSRAQRWRCGSLHTKRPASGAASTPASAPASSRADAWSQPPRPWPKSAAASTKALAPGPAQRSRTFSPGATESACAAKALAPLTKQHGNKGNGASGLQPCAAATRGSAPSASSPIAAAARKAAACGSEGGWSGQSSKSGISSWGLRPCEAQIRSWTSAAVKQLTKARCRTGALNAS